MRTYRIARAFLFVCLLGSVCGCPSLTRPNVRSVDMTVRDKDGVVALEFDKWYLVFEGIPIKGVKIGDTGYIHYPLPEGKGGSSGGGFYGSLKINQTHNTVENTVQVNHVEFKIIESGAKLVFADQTYEAQEPLRTIIVGKDGKTRDASPK